MEQDNAMMMGADAYTLEMSDDELRAAIASDERIVEMAGWHDNYTDADRARHCITVYKRLLAVAEPTRRARAEWLREIDAQIQVRREAWCPGPNDPQF